jgi:hypothetical protein
MNKKIMMFTCPGQALRYTTDCDVDKLFFIQAASNLANMPKTKNKKENMKYASWAASRIMEKYQVKMIKLCEVFRFKSGTAGGNLN